MPTNAICEALNNLHTAIRRLSLIDPSLHDEISEIAAEVGQAAELLNKHPLPIGLYCVTKQDVTNEVVALFSDEHEGDRLAAALADPEDSLFRSVFTACEFEPVFDTAEAAVEYLGLDAELTPEENPVA